MDDPEYKTFMRYCTEFFVTSDLLWRKAPNRQHKIVVLQERWLFLIASAHDDVGHHGHFATHALLSERYWWPNMSKDIPGSSKLATFVKSGRFNRSTFCQLLQFQHPSSPSGKVYMDMMHLPLSNSFKYIVQARCSLIHWPEWEMLRKKTAKNIARFIMNNLIYCWGTLSGIVTDNGAPFMKALAYLEKHYHIKHIQISGYNSHTNSLVE
jgi:hypothetical protein